MILSLSEYHCSVGGSQKGSRLILAENGEIVIRDRHSIRTFIFGILLAVIGINALQFATHAANPLVASDDWSAVDTVIRKLPSGNFHVTDLFVKRSALDHSQPLHKLIMIWHYKYLHLDFSIEAVIGVVFAFFNLGLIWCVVRAPFVEGRPIPTSTLLGFAALAGIYLSLNSSIVFSWPLLTFTYTSHAFIILFIIAIWSVLKNNSNLYLAVLFAVALLMDVITDDVGFIATVAASIAVLIQYFGGLARRQALKAALIIIAAYCVYKLAYALFVPVPFSDESEAIGLVSSIRALLEQAPDAWKWLAIPLTAPVIHRFPLVTYVGEDAAAVAVIGIALVVFCAHVWFWRRGLRGSQNLTSFLATSLMLMFYGLIAAILVARISMHDSNYLWQPRYVLLYEWNIMALILMAIAQPQRVASLHEQTKNCPSPRNSTSPLGNATFIMAALLLLLLQIPLSLNSWNRMTYSKVYQQRMAAQIAQLADHPQIPPDKCIPQIVVCNFPVEQRVRILRFLKAKRLNLFSRGFQVRNGLYPHDID